METEELSRAFDEVEPAPEGVEESIGPDDLRGVASVDLGEGPDKTVVTVAAGDPPMSVLAAKDAHRIQRARMFTSMVNAMATGVTPSAIKQATETYRPNGPLVSPPRLPQRHFPALTGRNDPCPCGSGKKYKKCHVGKDLRTKL